MNQKVDATYQYGDALFREVVKLFPQHQFQLIDVFVAGLDDDREHTYYHVKCDGKILQGTWPRLPKKDWKKELAGIPFDEEWVRMTYEQFMVELKYWRVNDPDTGDYFPDDPDRWFMYVDNRTNRPVKEYNISRVIFPEV